MALESLADLLCSTCSCHAKKALVLYRVRSLCPTASSRRTHTDVRLRPARARVSGRVRSGTAAHAEARAALRRAQKETHRSSG